MRMRNRNNSHDLRRGVLVGQPLSTICYEPWGDALASVEHQQYFAFAPQGSAIAMKHEGTAVAGGIEASTGHEGQSFILGSRRTRRSVASTGEYGVAHTSIDGFACAGTKGVLLFPYLDSKGYLRYTVAHVGEDGIQPYIYYCVADDKGTLKRAPDGV